MRLIKPSVSIEHITTDAIKLIEKAGRTCYKSEDRITSGSGQDFIAMILKRGHESVIEHASATVRFICDRGVTHEIVRHRLASFSQESTRYCDYNGGEIEFIIPEWCDINPGVYQYAAGVPEEISGADAFWFSGMTVAEATYRNLRELGWRPEQARSVLPNSLKTEIVMTCNLREWRHFLKLRTGMAAHPQMREVAIPLLHAMRKELPGVFEDIM